MIDSFKKKREKMNEKILDLYKKTLSLSNNNLDDYNNAVCHFSRMIDADSMVASDINQIAEYNMFFLKLLIKKINCSLNELRPKASSNQISIGCILETLMENDIKIEEDFKRHRHVFYDYMIT